MLSADNSLKTETDGEVLVGVRTRARVHPAWLGGVNALIGDNKASLITLAKCLGSSPSSARFGGLRWGSRARL